MLIAGGCKQAETEVDSTNGKTGSGKQDSSDKKTGATSTKGAEKLVDVPEGVVEYIYKPYESITFTAAQKEAADKLIKARGAELRDIRQRRTKLLTPEMRTKRTEAIKKAKASGGDVDAAEKAAVGDEVSEVEGRHVPGYRKFWSCPGGPFDISGQGRPVP